MDAAKTLTVGPGGRVVIPAEYRRRMGIETGDDVVAVLEGTELRLFTPRHAIKRAQERVRQYVSTDESLATELLAERRAKASGH